VCVGSALSYWTRHRGLVSRGLVSRTTNSGVCVGSALSYWTRHADSPSFCQVTYIHIYIYTYIYAGLKLLVYEVFSCRPCATRNTYIYIYICIQRQQKDSCSQPCANIAYKASYTSSLRPHTLVAQGRIYTHSGSKRTAAWSHAPIFGRRVYARKLCRAHPGAPN
jgi:hypothetical protein